MKQKSQNLGLLLLPGLDWLTLLSLHFLQACVFFFQVFWSKFATLLKFFSNKTTNKNQPLLNFTFYHVFIPSVTFVLHLTFSIFHFHLTSLSIAFFLVSWASFFSFSISDCLFWVSALDISWVSSNLFVMSSTSCLFSERSSPPRPVHLISSLVFD